MADAVIDLPENDPAIDRAVKIIEENLIKEMPDCHVTNHKIINVIYNDISSRS